MNTNRTGTEFQWPKITKNGSDKNIPIKHISFCPQGISFFLTPDITQTVSLVQLSLNHLTTSAILNFLGVFRRKLKFQELFRRF